MSPAASYGASLLRYKQIKTGLSGGTQTTYHVDRSLEIEKQGTRTTYRHYIDGIAILNREDIGASTTWKLGFNLKDRLGSVVTLADDSGTVLEHRSYDPFGKPRQGDFIDAGTIQAAIAGDPHPELNLDPLTDRGFTDHEHLDEQDIIHMNGRVFDYNIGRFTSVDPFIQAPGFSQSINPYSYIMNNPLSGVDPSGYESHPPEEKVAPTTGSRLKTETKYSDGNDSSVTADRSGRITGMTGKVTIKDGVITLGGNDKNKVDLMFEGSIPWKGVPDGGVFGPNSRAQNGGSQTDNIFVAAFDGAGHSGEDGLITIGNSAFREYVNSLGNGVRRYDSGSTTRPLDSAVEDALAFVAKNPDGVILATGYSAGGRDAIFFARRLSAEGITVRRLVTFDAKSACRPPLFGRREYSVPDDVRGTNFYQRGGRPFFWRSCVWCTNLECGFVWAS